MLNISREISIKILHEIFEKGAYSNIVLNKYLQKNDLKSQDKALITEIVYGTVKYRNRLDYIIAQFSNTKLKKISAWILNILRMSVYQIIFMDKIPHSAAVNEAVELSKKYGHVASGKFVNGVLRNISRNCNDIKYPDEENEPVRYLSVVYAHPEWIVEKWIKQYGYKFTKQLLDANNKIPNYCIRVNTLKTSRDELINLLNDYGIEVQNSKFVEQGLIVKNPQGITNLDLYHKGYFTIQDESSMMTANVLMPSENDTVIDVCSAPGGKTTHIAEIMKNTGKVIARDMYLHKIELIKASVDRLGIRNVVAEVFDAMVLDENLVSSADKVLVDAPCTGFGIIRRKPDIKWTKCEEDCEEINSIQYKILNVSSKYVKVGGILVYSTCTIEDRENVEIIKRFLQENDDFVMEDISGCVCADLDVATKKDGYIQLYPNLHGTDGFFIAKMKKIK